MNLVQGSGPLDSKIWIIGDKPGEQEEKEGTVFVGTSGRFLRDKLSVVGVDCSSVRLENLVNTRPVKNDFKYFEIDPIRKAGLLENIAQLKERIKENKPNILILLGAQPLYYLTGHTGIGDWRGHIQWIQSLSVKAIATYHPETALRQRFVDKGQNPGQYEVLFQADLVKALNDSRDRELLYPKYSLITRPTFHEAIDKLKHIRDHASLVSYDIETLYHSLIDCIGFSYIQEGSDVPTESICIPFVYAGKSLIPYSKNASETLELLRLCFEILESDVPKVAQNSQFDTVILNRYYQCKVKNVIWDTMVMAHNLYCDLPKDLGSNMALYTNMPYHKHMIGEDRWSYNAADAIANIFVMLGQKKEALDLGILEHYQRVTNPAIRVIGEMQCIGVKVDEKLRTYSIQREHDIMEDIIQAFDEAIPVQLQKDQKKFPHRFNPGSWQQKQTLLYDLLGCRKMYNKGGVTTDDDALRKIEESTNKDSIRTLIQAIRKYEAASSMASRLETPLLEGRFHTSYFVGGTDETSEDTQWGTDTGRLNSKRSFFYVLDPVKKKYVPAGTNAQNFKKGIQRQMLLPNEGEEFCLVDLWAAEAYLTALDASEEKYLALLDKGIKIHKWLLEKITEVFPNEVKEAEFDYKGAKQFVHSLNYDVEARRMSKESGMPINVCEWAYSFYHNEFPGIKARQRRIKEEVQRTRQLTSALGRKITFIQPMSHDLYKRAYAWSSQSCIGELAILAMSKLFHIGISSSLSGEYPWIFPSLNTHDGLACRVRKETREKVEDCIKEAFRIPLSKEGVTITIPVECGFAKNFNDMEEESVKILWYQGGPDVN